MIICSEELTKVLQQILSIFATAEHTTICVKNYEIIIYSTIVYIQANALGYLQRQRTLAKYAEQLSAQLNTEARNNKQFSDNKATVARSDIL